MVVSTMKIKRGVARQVGSVLALLILWQILSFQFANGIVIASPCEVVRTLWGLAGTGAFWRRLLFSFSRVGLGFLCSAVAASGAAILSFRFPLFDAFLNPCVFLMKSVPVAIITVLLLILFSASGLSAFVVLLMTFPVIYTTILAVIRDVDQKLLDMSYIFHWSEGKKWRWIRLPTAWESIKAALSVSSGMAWKAGVSAEVIGTPRESIGEAVYDAKIYLATEELFAWCIVILALSWIMERLCVMLFDAAAFLLWRTGV